MSSRETGSAIFVRQPRMSFWSTFVRFWRTQYKLHEESRGRAASYLSLEWEMEGEGFFPQICMANGRITTITPCQLQEHLCYYLLMKDRVRVTVAQQTARMSKQAFVGEDTNMLAALLSGTNDRCRAVVCARLSRLKVMVNLKTGILILVLEMTIRRQGDGFDSQNQGGFYVRPTTLAPMYVCRARRMKATPACS